MENKLTCPDCGDEEVLVSSIQTWNANTDEYWCESVKPTDSDSPAKCLNCGWNGERQQLTGFTWE
jgi:predicted RNA-binding Zn-ribbon protein involved in translation (DUF1610 family)